MEERFIVFFKMTLDLNDERWISLSDHKHLTYHGAKTSILIDKENKKRHYKIEKIFI